jgi:hypothetical protein
MLPSLIETFERGQELISQAEGRILQVRLNRRFDNAKVRLEASVDIKFFFPMSLKCFSSEHWSGASSCLVVAYSLASHGGLWAYDLILDGGLVFATVEPELFVPDARVLDPGVVGEGALIDRT